MGAKVIRQNLVDNINRSFHSRNVGKTAKKLMPHLDAGADVFDLVHSLGFLDEDMKASRAEHVSHYKAHHPMPFLHKRILTLAFRTALLHRPRPIPLELDIVSGTAESIAVTASSKSVKVVLTRDDRGSRKKKG